jgi:hypothetical protein
LGRFIQFPDVRPWLFRKCSSNLTALITAPTTPPQAIDSPKLVDLHPYRHVHLPQQQFFDLDLDLNPDL